MYENKSTSVHRSRKICLTYHEFECYFIDREESKRIQMVFVSNNVEDSVDVWLNVFSQDILKGEML